MHLHRVAAIGAFLDLFAGPDGPLVVGLRGLVDVGEGQRFRLGGRRQADADHGGDQATTNEAGGRLAVIGAHLVVLPGSCGVWSVQGGCTQSNRQAPCLGDCIRVIPPRLNLVVPADPCKEVTTRLWSMPLRRLTVASGANHAPDLAFALRDCLQTGKKDHQRMTLVRRVDHWTSSRPGENYTEFLCRG